MKKVSTKQAKKNYLVHKAKNEKDKICVICNQYCENGDPVHLMNKNIYPQYYTEPANIHRGHRECHTKYDDNKAFRMQQKQIIEIVRTFASEQEINQYFT